jgi:hypothetical protein
MRTIGKIFAVMVLGSLMSSIISNEASSQFAVDERLFGTWSKDGTGELLKISSNGDVDIFLAGQATVFSGNGSIERCSEGGANLCIAGPRLKCAFRSAFTQGVLNLQFRTGSPDIACRALSGDFRRRD